MSNINDDASMENHESNFLDNMIREIVRQDSIRVLDAMRGDDDDKRLSRTNLYNMYSIAVTMGGWNPPLECSSAEELFSNKSEDIHDCMTSAFHHILSREEGVELMMGIVDMMHTDLPPSTFDGKDIDNSNNIEFNL